MLDVMGCSAEGHSIADRPLLPRASQTCHLCIAALGDALIGILTLTLVILTGVRGFKNTECSVPLPPSARVQCALRE